MNQLKQLEEKRSKLTSTKICSGALFMSLTTGRYFLIQRSKTCSAPFTWAFVGGKMEKDEEIMDGLYREIKEEIGFVPEVIKYYPFDHFISDDKKFEYASILIIVKDEFLPMLNDESSGYCWVEAPKWPKYLHPGAKITLRNLFLKSFSNIRDELLTHQVDQTP